jgi:hypothetical protein
MVEFTVLNLYHEIRSLNSELETKEYWNYRRYFGEKQHKYCMMGIVVVLKRHYDIIMIVVPV